MLPSISMRWHKRSVTAMDRMWLPSWSGCSGQKAPCCSTGLLTEIVRGSLSGVSGAGPGPRWVRDGEVVVAHRCDRGTRGHRNEAARTLDEMCVMVGALRDRET